MRLSLNDGPALVIDDRGHGRPAPSRHRCDGGSLVASLSAVTSAKVESQLPVRHALRTPVEPAPYRVQKAGPSPGLCANYGFVRQVRQDVIGTEWREHAEERSQPVSRALLRLSLLRRQRDDIVTAHGRNIYDHIEANLRWEVFQFLGKLLPVVYVLARTSAR